MTKIVVSKTEIKTGTNSQGPWTLTKITDGNGNVYSTFDEKAGVLKAGDAIDAEIETKGQNKNIKSWKIYGTPDLVTSKPYKPSNRLDNTASIESQTAAKIGGELLAHGIINPTDPLGVAVIDWCYARLPHK